MKKSTCTITGTDYKNLPFGCNEKESTCINLKLSLAEIITRLASEGVTEFITNCEYGIPLFVAEIICGLKKYNDIHLHIEVPFEEHNINWYEDVRDRYYAVHQQADIVHIPYSYELENEEPYRLCDKIMAEQSDMILYVGIINDKPFIAEYAKEQGIPVIYFEPHASVCFFDA